MKIKTKNAIMLFFRESDVELRCYVGCLSGSHECGCIRHDLAPGHAHLLQSNPDPAWLVPGFGDLQLITPKS